MKVNKYTLMSSNYDPDSGVSVVKINTDVGVFEGIAHCHPEEEYESRMFGCELAELRAIRKYLRELVKIGNAQLDALYHLYNSVYDMKDFNYDNFYASKIRRAMYAKKDEIDRNKADIERIDVRIKAMPKEREIIMKKMRGSI